METETLAQIVARLSPEQQAAVHKFIEFIKDRKGKSGDTPFKDAVEEFMTEHSELLRLLAD